MIFNNIQQNTAEWLQFKCGKLSASRMRDVMARGVKGQPLKARADYLMEIVCERLTGFTVEHYVTPAMDWGITTERHARAAYEVETGNEVDRVGIAVHPKLDFLVASPDGAIGERGLFEAKCPTTAKHIEWMLAGEVPEEHRIQCYTQMACWDRDWEDFVSYDPRVPERHQLFVKQLARDEKRIAEIEFAAIEFEGEVRAMIARLDGRNPFKEKLRKSVDAEQFITDSDIEWAKAQQEAM